MKRRTIRWLKMVYPTSLYHITDALLSPHTFLASAIHFCMASQRFGQYFFAPSSELQRLNAFSSDSLAGIGLSVKYMSDSFRRLMKRSFAVSLLAWFVTLRAISRTYEKYFIFAYLLPTSNNILQPS